MKEAALEPSKAWGETLKDHGSINSGTRSEDPRDTCDAPADAFRKPFHSRFSAHSPVAESIRQTARTCLEGPFGEVVRATGSMAKANPFRFSTKYQDDETDLLYYGYRYYDASTGRWLSRDPIEERGGIALYVSFKNDSTSSSDPLGLSLLSYQLGLEWVLGLNSLPEDPGYHHRALSWRDFDPTGNTVATLKQQWLLQNREALRKVCWEIPLGETRDVEFSSSTATGMFENRTEPWISGYEAKAYVSPLRTKVLISNTSGCCCEYSVLLQFMANDTANFDPGHRFGPFDLLRDDWFLALQRYTPLGHDYVESAITESLLNYRDCANP